MPKLRALLESPPQGQGTPEEQIRELRNYLARMQEELYYLLTHLERDNTGSGLWKDIQGEIPEPYNGSPQMDGVASPGVSNFIARGDHRHPKDSSKADASALSAHVGDTGNPHAVTKAQVGLDNVANERQYSADNPPPLPGPGDIGAVPATRKINGYALSADVTLSAADVGAVPTSAVGTASGIAELDANGKVPSAQLPAYVDDVLEYASASAFPATGESGKIYVALDTELTYRWSGSNYVEISPSLALGETSSTAYRGDRGKAAYDHSQLTSGNPHNVTAAEAGAQPTVTASGLLMGDGAGGISAATAGVDYATPAQIPSPSDATPQALGTAAAGSSPDYSRADHVHDLPGYDAEDIEYDPAQSGMQAVTVQAAIDELAASGGGPSPSDVLPEMDGTAAAGSSTAYSRGDHVHPSDTSKADQADFLSSLPIWINIPSTSSLPLTVSDADITADHELTELAMSNPSAMSGAWTWATAAGALTISGTVSSGSSTTMRAKLEIKIREVNVT